MGVQNQESEYGDKDPVRVVASVTSENGSDRDLKDRDQLARLGKKSVLRRNFTFLTILGFSCSLLVTWEGTLMNIAPGLTNGGPGGLIYGFIFVWIGNLSVFSTLCEVLSIAPTSGGQYHWVSMLAPSSCSKFLSYITGWMTLAGWQGTCAAASYLFATMLQGLVSFTTPSYQATTWQGTLILFLCIIVAVFINTLISSMLPKLEGTLLIVHILAFFGILISLVTFTDSTDASYMFKEFRNDGNWPTQGLSFFVGLLGCVYCFVGVDCSFHMCEEVQNPSLAVPRSIMSSIVINGIMGLSMIIAQLYGATDLQAALDSETGYPYMEILYQATKSKVGTAVITSIILLLTLSSVVGVIASTSRMFWAFARDRGLPFSSLLARVDPWTKVPVWAVTVPSVLSCLLGMINLGSSVVYNALISISVSGLYSSYIIAAILLLYRRVQKDFVQPDASAMPFLTEADGEGRRQLIWGPWHVPGVFGIVNNAFACLFMFVVWFFAFWPPSTPTVASNMNFAILMTGGLVIFSIVYYFLWARRQYKGPRMEV